MLYKNILLVDDDREDAEIFRDALQVLGKEIVFHAVYDPLDALEKLKKAHQLPDLIFLDYNMPFLNGVELLAKFQNEKKICEIPVIIISAPSDEFVQDLLKTNKIIKYISKPNTFVEMVNILKAIL